MTVRTFRGPDIRTLMNQVREEFGEGAIILSTTHLNDSVEVSVGLPVAFNDEVISLKDQIEVSTYEIESYKNDGIAKTLKEQGVHGKVIRKVLSLLSEEYQPSEEAKGISEGFEPLMKIDSGLPLHKKFIALIGPTGVGKTTTIAKLAAQIQTAFGYKIGLLSADTFRVGAAFHLQSYAKIMQLPFKMINPEKPVAEQMLRASESFKDCDLVFIDTPGCSCFDKDRIEGLKQDLSQFKTIEKILVLPAPSNQADLKNVARAFSRVGYDRVIISKLDESGFIGPVLNTVLMENKPMAFLTTGQKVPEDIEPASLKRISWMLSRTIH